MQLLGYAISAFGPYRMALYGQITAPQKHSNTRYVIISPIFWTSYYVAN